MTRFALLATLPLALVACATVEPQEPRMNGEGECRNEPLAQFVGRQQSDALGAEIRRASGARLIQWINPGEMVTMEFRADRVRVTLDSNRRVEVARCG